MQRESPDPAVEVPQAARRGTVRAGPVGIRIVGVGAQTMGVGCARSSCDRHALVEGAEPTRGPGGDLAVQPGGDGRVRLGEAARTQVQDHVAHGHGQGRLRGEDDLFGALHDCLVGGVDVRGDDARAGDQLGQEGQGRTQLSEVTAGTQDETDHEVTRQGRRHEDVLEFPAPCDDVVGFQAQTGDEGDEGGQGTPDRGVGDRTVPEVHTATVGAEDSKRRGVDGAAHHHLRLRAEPLGR